MARLFTLSSWKGLRCPLHPQREPLLRALKLRATRSSLPCALQLPQSQLAAKYSRCVCLWIRAMCQTALGTCGLVRVLQTISRLLEKCGPVGTHAFVVGSTGQRFAIKEYPSPAAICFLAIVLVSQPRAHSSPMATLISWESRRRLLRLLSPAPRARRRQLPLLIAAGKASARVPARLCGRTRQIGGLQATLRYVSHRRTLPILRPRTRRPSPPG